jgi:hypothetical protein
MLNRDEIRKILNNNIRGEKYTPEDAMRVYQLLKTIAESQVKKIMSNKREINEPN